MEDNLNKIAINSKHIQKYTYNWYRSQSWNKCLMIKITPQKVSKEMNVLRENVKIIMQNNRLKISTFYGLTI